MVSKQMPTTSSIKEDLATLYDLLTEVSDLQTELDFILNGLRSKVTVTAPELDSLITKFTKSKEVTEDLAETFDDLIVLCTKLRNHHVH